MAIVIHFHGQARRNDAATDSNDIVHEHVERGWFRAGSHSGYNYWRNTLAEMVGYPTVNGMSSAEYVWCNDCTGKPFVELINIRDHDGEIDAETCAKLEQDFIDHACKAADIGDYFYSNYVDFMKAFSVAKNNGSVVFTN